MAAQSKDPPVSVIARQCAHCRGNPFLSVRVTRLAAGSTDSHTSDTVTGSE